MSTGKAAVIRMSAAVFIFIFISESHPFKPVNELGNSLGVALCDRFQTAVPVVFALSGIVYDKNVCHCDYLRVLFGNYSLTYYFR